MKKNALATRYRPQTFSEVAGQELVCRVLAKAAAEEHVAAAYLFSGTRGVGKTTMARIFAKALNCQNAPTEEPCGVCDQCRKIATSTHVDVAEIDGASNNSVDDTRALRESIGFVPMEARYKVFIIDEAHMLSRSAFNALLKTLEEPPPRVVFIFATTEAHKFPITIVSRCQHFVFRHLSEAGIEAHLRAILTKENIAFEESAVRIIARRAAGSVRDSLSLLDQVLALGDNEIKDATVRTVLGLATEEFFENLLLALARSDCKAVISLSQDMFAQGIDIGFLLRDLVSYLRNLFLLSQSGMDIAPVLGLRVEQAERYLQLAKAFSPAHLHSAWQMSLESQRNIVHNPEPAAALDLLLLNIAMLPKLLPVGQVANYVPSQITSSQLNCNTTTNNNSQITANKSEVITQSSIETVNNKPTSLQTLAENVTDFTKQDNLTKQANVQHKPQDATVAFVESKILPPLANSDSLNSKESTTITPKAPSQKLEKEQNPKQIEVRQKDQVKKYKGKTEADNLDNLSNFKDHYSNLQELSYIPAEIAKDPLIAECVKILDAKIIGCQLMEDFEIEDEGETDAEYE